MRISRRKAGSEIRCPKCSQRVIVPTPPEKALEGILVDPESEVLSLPPSEPESDEDDYEPLPIRKRRHRRRATRIWRWVTVPALCVSLMCFFLPWVRYTVIIPPNPIILQDRFELASQSGLYTSLGVYSLHPAIGRWGKAEQAKLEAKWRKDGKDPFEELLKANKPYMAPWLLGFPLAIFFAIMVTFVAEPTNGVLMSVGGLILAASLLLFVQFSILGPPGEHAIYDAIIKSSGVEDALFASLLLDVQYTVWFIVAIIGLVFALMAQGVCLGLKQTR